MSRLGVGVIGSLRVDGGVRSYVDLGNGANTAPLITPEYGLEV